MIIQAEAHSDDRVFEVPFDAAPWFETASDEDVTELAACGWGGDYPADKVATEMLDDGIGDDTEELGHMFAYINAKNKVRVTVGFEVSVSEEDAMRWLDEHRPELAALIRQNQEEGSW